MTQKPFRWTVRACFRCDGCGALQIAVASGMSTHEDPLAWLLRNKRAEWLPKPVPDVPARAFPDVPPEIAAAAIEAYRCRDIADANRAAILLARSVIEATAKDKGIANGSLEQKIERLCEQRLIRPDVREGADEVRHLGNDMAHGDFGQAVRSEDADLMLALMNDVLVDVYQSPARVAQARVNREARQRAAAAIVEGRPLQTGSLPGLQQALLLFASGTIRQAKAASAEPEETPQ